VTKSTAKTILERIRGQNTDPYGIMKVVNPQPEEIEFAKSYLSADDWQKFKRDFVEEYGGEPVQPTGMTHSEFLHYIKTSGERENSQFDNKAKKLRAILESFDKIDN